MPRATFREQVGGGAARVSAGSMSEQMTFAMDIDHAVAEATSPFESKFAPSDMRQLALVAHNHMKPAM